MHNISQRDNNKIFIRIIKNIFFSVFVFFIPSLLIFPLLLDAICVSKGEREWTRSTQLEEIDRESERKRRRERHDCIIRHQKPDTA